MKSIFILITILISTVIVGGLAGWAFAQQQDKSPEPQWLQLTGVGYYRILNETQIEIELNQSITEFGKAISPANFAKAQADVSDFGVKLIQTLIKTNSYAGYVASHRRLVLTKYRSEDWDKLLKDLQKLFKEIK